MTTVPTSAEVATILGKAPASPALLAAYKAELEAQALRCRVEPYTEGLAAALVRRVSRNLAMASIPLGVMVDGEGATRISSNDPEVRRLEGPFRKVVLG